MSKRFSKIYLYLHGSNLASQAVSSKNNVHTQLRFGSLSHLATESDEKGAKLPSTRRPSFKNLPRRGGIKS